MLKPISDKGIACIATRSDGTPVVMVARAFERGEPKDVYAAHNGNHEVRFAPGVESTSVGSYTVTTDVVEVANNDDLGGVDIRPIVGDRNGSLTERLTSG